MLYDLAIRDGLVIDGTGGPPVHADIGIVGGAVATVGSVGEAHETIDAGGRVVAPGFVDAHTHDDVQLCRDPHNREKVLQGVTSVICGNCGFSAFPNVGGKTSADLLRTDGDWESFAEYAASLEHRGIGPNMAAFVGHNTLGTHFGHSKHERPGTKAQAQMVDLVGRAVSEGALGLSTGLIYEPGRYCDTADLVGVTKAAAEGGGLYSSHIRSEAEGLLDAIDEALHIATSSGAGLQISHLKCAGPPNWGAIDRALGRIDAAYADGVDVGFDVYPYTAGSGPFEQYFDPKNPDEDRLHLVQIVRCPDFPHFEGHRIPDIAEREGSSVVAVMRSILEGPRAEEALCVIFEIDENEMRTVLSHPRAMVGSDGIPQDGGVPHPRLLGTFPRVLGHYGRDEGLFDLPQAIAKVSAIPAERFGLAARGKLLPGYWADLVVFDHDTIDDRASYVERKGPVGIDWVLVNGVAVVGLNGLTESLPGRVLRRNSPQVPT